MRLIAFTGNTERKYDSITVGNEVRKNIVYITIYRRIFAKYVKFVNCYFLKIAGNSIREFFLIKQRNCYMPLVTKTGGK